MFVFSSTTNSSCNGSIATVAILLCYPCFKHQTMLAGKVLDYLVAYVSRDHKLMLA